MRLFRSASVMLAVLALAGCGGGHDRQPAPPTAPAVPQAAWGETTIDPIPTHEPTIVASLWRALSPPAAWAQVADTFTFSGPPPGCAAPSYCGTYLNVAVDNAGAVPITTVDLRFTVAGMTEIRNRLLDPQDPRYCWPVGQPKPASPPLAIDPRTGQPFNPRNEGGCNFPNSPPLAVIDANGGGTAGAPGLCLTVDGVEYCVVLTSYGSSAAAVATPLGRVMAVSIGDSRWTMTRGLTRPFALEVRTNGVLALTRTLTLVVP